MGTPGPLVICVEGEIGAGKSTLLLPLAAAIRRMGFRVAVAPEPVEEWRRVGILQLFYADPKANAYAFQTYTFITRTAALRQALADCPGCDVLVTERSPFTDRYIFMEPQREVVGPVYMAMYENWWSTFWPSSIPALASSHWHMVYVKPDLEACMSRVVARHRDGELMAAASSSRAARAPGSGGVSREYQQTLRQRHEWLLETLSGRSALPSSHSVFILQEEANRDFRGGEHQASAVAAVLDSLGPRLLPRSRAPPAWTAPAGAPALPEPAVPMPAGAPAAPPAAPPVPHAALPVPHAALPET